VWRKAFGVLTNLGLRLKRWPAACHHRFEVIDTVKSTSLVLLLTIVGWLGPHRAGAADDPLGDVVRLYGAAAYEETLASLDRLDYGTFGEKVDEYRALCFLALDRDLEAEEAMESLIGRRPQPLDGIGLRPPKFVALYGSVRRRLIPAVATAAYNRAKASLERRDFLEAAAAFAETSTLASGEGSEHLSDLRLLADEFRSLSEQQLYRAPAPPLPEAVLATALPLPSFPPPPPPREFLPIARVYGPDDHDVKPPTVIDQTLPAWNFPKVWTRDRTFHGALIVVVDEDGTVASAEIARPSFFWYDERLLKAARRWRYRPAMKGDRAVQYRRVIEFTVRRASTPE
jgi:TonB family protein